MPTITMTEELAKALGHLKNDWAICFGYLAYDERGVRGTYRRGYGICSITTNPRCEVDISEDTFNKLKAYRLIKKRDRDNLWWHTWYGARVWVLSDAGKSVPVPPKKLWAEE